MKYASNRTFSILLGVMLVAVTPLVLSASAASTSRRYIKYTVDTEAVEYYTLILDDASSAVSTYSDVGVIGDDDRYQDGNTGIVRLVNVDTNLGSSAFIVGDHVVAISAHCVYFKDSATWANNHVIRMYDQNGYPTSVEYPIVEIHIPYEYTENSSDKYDYALLTINADLSGYSHFNLGYPYDLYNENFENVTLYASGCPQYINGVANGDPAATGSSGRLVYTGEGNIVQPSSYDNDILYLDADITYGDSGGPIYVKEMYCVGTTTYTVNTAISMCSGIHTVNNELYNMGPVMTPTLLQFYRNNSYISY